MSLAAKPDRTKHSRTGENVRVAYGCSTMRGYRDQQEDRYAIHLELPVAGSSVQHENMFCGVYDGHRGSTMAEHVSNTLHVTLAASEAYQNRRYPEALDKSFRRMDQDVRDGKVVSDDVEEEDRNYPNPKGEPTASGCTATVALLSGLQLTVANAGDSRAVLCRDGKATRLSTDHSPYEPGELRRIKAAGSTVVRGKVGMMLAMTRSLGDIGAKSNPKVSIDKQAILGSPDVTETRLTLEDEFMVLATDGVWNSLLDRDKIGRTFLKELDAPALEAILARIGCLPEKVSKAAMVTKVDGLSKAEVRRAINPLNEEDQYTVYASGEATSSQNVCDAVRWCIAQRLPLAKVCECVLDFCFENFNGNDNMTIVVVAFLHGRSLKEWYTWVANRVRRAQGRKTRIFETFEPRPDSSMSLNQIVKQALQTV
ncbi:protein serine/threonine phosphatase 2C [Calocera viscosa TUFC12733]|uniref:Protein serine/threonine phosphatase 2C n=1 Tax=Calocera viscosa (strain TUFC12733) TaxID=1330018 RepID=A0A167QUP7_CALVF|nr:protein serine/threonine phosphatase 2C [Calocera viscosa TUFC12733]